MTLVLGIRCKDTFVLCADQQITFVSSHKYRDEKLDAMERDGWSVTFGYSGLPGLYREVTQKIMAILSSMEKGANEGVVEEPPVELTFDEIYAAIEHVLNSMGRNEIQENLHMLFGIDTPRETPRLLIFSNGGLHEAEQDDHLVFLGNGDSSLVRFLKDALYPSRSPLLTVEQAKNLGIYLIARAAQYIDGVEEPISVAVVGCLVEWLSEKEIQQRKRTMTELEGRVLKKFI